MTGVAPLWMRVQRVQVRHGPGRHARCSVSVCAAFCPPTPHRPPVQELSSHAHAGGPAVSSAGPTRAAAGPGVLLLRPCRLPRVRASEWAGGWVVGVGRQERLTLNPKSRRAAIEKMRVAQWSSLPICSRRRRGGAMSPHRFAPPSLPVHSTPNAASTTRPPRTRRAARAATALPSRVPTWVLARRRAGSWSSRPPPL